MSSSHLNTIFAIQRELIGQLAQGQQGESLVESLLKPRVKSGREIMAEALTGRVRSDAALYRQARRNAEEGAQVAEALLKGTDEILESLGTLQSITEKMSETGYTPNADDETAFNAAKQSIIDTVKNSSYNGISFFDASQWAGDERITPTGGSSGELRIQTGKTYKSIVLSDLTGMSNSLAGREYDALTQNAGERDGLKTELGTFSKDVSLQRSGFNALSSGFSSIAETLNRNAEINDKAASRSILGARDDLLGRLLYAMLREQGSIIDKPS